MNEDGINNEYRESTKVFFSYAREDQRYAEKLYYDLKKHELDPWFDQQSLQAGDRWRGVIEERIRNSEFFIILLSSRSVKKKTGYVHKEWEEALDVFSKEKKEFSKFVIPVRIDECTITNKKIREFHIINLYPVWEQGIRKLLDQFPPQL